jgi:hypothetical protein
VLGKALRFLRLSQRFERLQKNNRGGDRSLSNRFKMTKVPFQTQASDEKRRRWRQKRLAAFINAEPFPVQLLYTMTCKIGAASRYFAVRWRSLTGLNSAEKTVFFLENASPPPA